MTGIKPLLREVLALKQELTGRESQALEASAKLSQGLGKPITQWGEGGDEGTTARSIPQIADSQAPSLSTRLCRCHEALTSASRGGVRKGVIPLLSIPWKGFSTLLEVYLPSHETKKAGVFSSPPHACNGVTEREQSSSAQKHLGGIIWNANVKRLAQGRRENQWQNEQANYREVFLEEYSANHRYTHPTYHACIHPIPLYTHGTSA